MSENFVMFFIMLEAIFYYTYITVKKEVFDYNLLHFILHI